MGCIVFAIVYFVIGVLQLLNVPTVFTKGFSEKIENEILRRSYMRICGVISIVLSAVFTSMVWGEKLLSLPQFWGLYLSLGAVVVVWQRLINKKYLGSWR